MNSIEVLKEVSYDLISTTLVRGTVKSVVYDHLSQDLDVLSEKLSTETRVQFKSLQRLSSFEVIHTNFPSNKLVLTLNDLSFRRLLNNVK